MASDTPAKKLKKYKKGTIRYQDGAGLWIEKPFIDTYTSENKCKFYVLNEWDEFGRPVLVPQAIAEVVVDNSRRYRRCKLHNHIRFKKKKDRVPVQAYIDPFLYSDVKRCLAVDGGTFGELIEGSFRLYLEERAYLKQHRKKPATYFNMLPKAPTDDPTNQ